MARTMKRLPRPSGSALFLVGRRLDFPSVFPSRGCGCPAPSAFARGGKPPKTAWTAATNRGKIAKSASFQSFPG